MQALVEAQHQALRARELAEQKEASADEDARAKAQRLCCICYDKMAVSMGVECGATTGDGAHGAPHFVCGDCFEGHVLTESEKALYDLIDRCGQIFCPLQRHGCPCVEPYSEQAIAAHCPAAVFGAYRQAQKRLQEQQLVQELEQQFEARLVAERARIAQMTADELQIVQMRHHVADRLLTLKCPRCEAAFLDFNGCFALTCHRCKCGFCAYCLADCGNDAHAHVAACPHNHAGGVFGQVANFEAAQRERRMRMVHEYLGTLPDGVRTRVVAACVHDFADLGINFQG